MHSRQIDCALYVWGVGRRVKNNVLKEVNIFIGVQEKGYGHIGGASFTIGLATYWGAGGSCYES